MPTLRTDRCGSRSDSGDDYVGVESRQIGDVHTYYEEDGEGDALVLLHPGLADSRAFAGDDGLRL